MRQLSNVVKLPTTLFWSSMTYNETLEYLFTQLPMYQRQGKAAYKADLSNTTALCNVLGNPENRFKSIHIAGTNGKGSTSNFIASALQEVGYRVGLYTSPHLVDFRERIRINGKMISEQLVIDFVAQYKDKVAEIQPSFFEWTVGLAFDYFASQDIDVAVIEVGLGGRLDSTNVITPLVSVITNIGLDHTQFLGETLPKVATEKAGIIKPNIPVVIGETQTETENVFKQKAAKEGTSILFADQENKLPGGEALISYQQKNAQTAWYALRAIHPNGFEVSEQQFWNGVNNVGKNTGFAGRWQTLQQNPKVILDTGHNIEGLTYTMAQLAEEEFETLRIVFGMVNDKAIDQVINMLPKNATYYLTQPSISRALPVEELAVKFSSVNKKKFNHPKEALSAALADSQKDDLVFVGGSTFVVADIL